MSTQTSDDKPARPGACDLDSHWIGGRCVPASMNAPIVVHDPADGSVLSHVPRGTAEEANAAMQAAQQAQPAWAAKSPADRRRILKEAVPRLAARAAEWSELLVRENGKPIATARAEVDFMIDCIPEFSELGVHLAGRSGHTGNDELMFQRVTPRGVAVCLNTWNAPLIVAIKMVVANLIVGNTAVLKTSERAPLATRMALQDAFQHLPAGVLNIVSGDGPNMGALLLAHEAMGVACFIGSIPVGRKVGETAGRKVRKAILELGGKDSLIIDETVNIDAAAAFAGPSCFANSGQICTSTERIYVSRNVVEPFLNAMKRVAEAIRVGPGLDPATQMGPLIDESILANVQRQVDDAIRHGARILTGGKRIDRPGYYFPPTVMTDLSDDMLIMQEETFGPIAPVIPVDSFDEAIERSNRSNFGLGAIVLTESADRAMQAIQSLECGMVRINAPRGQGASCCGEPAKDSGIGFGHGSEFLRELVHFKSVRWRPSIH